MGKIAGLATLATFVYITAAMADPVPPEAAEALLNDSTVWYLPITPNSPRQYFNKNGETSYIDAESNKTYGSWLVKGEKYCSIWPPSEHMACYGLETSTDSKGRKLIAFISGGNGKRYEGIIKAGKHLEVTLSE